MKAKKNLRIRRIWSLCHQFCQACGSTDRLQTHHIIYGAGGRHDAYTNFLRLCEPCHLEGVHGRGGRLSLAVVLWIKKKRDPSEYNSDLLTKLRCQSLPALEENPFEAQYQAAMAKYGKKKH